VGRDAMANPVEYTFWGYWRSMAMKTIKLLFLSWRIWIVVPTFIIVIISIFNKQIADYLHGKWMGVPPSWSVIVMGFLFLCAAAKAIYERDRELYSAYKANEGKLEELQDYNFMSLKVACDVLMGEKRKFGISYDNGTTELFNKNNHYNNLTNEFVKVDKYIYGKSPSGNFIEWIIINENRFTSGKVKIENGELVLYSPGTYIEDTPEYGALAIKKDNLSKDIDKIMDKLYIPLKEVIINLYDECRKDPILSPIITHIRERFSSQNALLNTLAFYFKHTLYSQLYGKNIQLGELTRIDTDQINRMYFDNEGSSLYSYLDRAKIYTDLYIKRDHYYLMAIEIFKQRLGEIAGYSKYPKP
jgi:hypothetical protein